MSHYSVALFCMVSGTYQGCVGRFGDGTSAHDHARHHTAAICQTSLDSLHEGKVTLPLTSGMNVTCACYSGPHQAPRHVDKLVAVVVPPLPLHEALHTMRARYEFERAA